MTDVIILTAYDSFAYAQTALRLGAVDFLLKPFHDGELEEAVRRVKRRQDANQQGEESGSLIPEVKRGDKSRYVRMAMEYIQEHYSEPSISVRTVADALGISDGHLSHTFKKETDLTLLNYLTRVRIRKAMELLRTCRYKVYEVADLVGYRDIAYFSTTFKKVAGVSPSEYLDAQ